MQPSWVWTGMKDSFGLWVGCHKSQCRGVGGRRKIKLTWHELNTVNMILHDFLKSYCNSNYSWVRESLEVKF